MNDVEDLHDHMNMVMQSCTVLRQNQRGLATTIDCLNDKIDAMDAHIHSIAVSEAERTLKYFKKEASGNSLSKEEKITDFDAHLDRLNIRSKQGQTLFPF